MYIICCYFSFCACLKSPVNNPNKGTSLLCLVYCIIWFSFFFISINIKNIHMYMYMYIYMYVCMCLYVSVMINLFHILTKNISNKIR